MGAKLKIIIYRGNPDTAVFRHTALFIESNDGSHLIVQIVGQAPFFRQDMRDDILPRDSQRFFKEILVAEITGKTTSQIGGPLFGTKISSGGDWNCQDWVCDALEVLSGKGWITASARSSAINRMRTALKEKS